MILRWFNKQNEEDKKFVTIHQQTSIERGKSYNW